MTRTMGFPNDMSFVLFVCCSSHGIFGGDGHDDLAATGRFTGRGDFSGWGVSWGGGVLPEHRIPADVDPVVLPGWNVARLAVGLVVGRHVARGLIRHEQGPTPAVAPQGVAGEAPLRVLDHHEP